VKFSFRVGEGFVGERIRRNLDQWLLAAPLANPAMIEMFRLRERNPRVKLVPWYGEFPGKYMTSAALAWRMTRDEKLKRMIDGLVDDLAGVQSAEGYIGPHPRAQRLVGTGGHAAERKLWDVWGHYHVLLGLLMWHEATANDKAWQVCQKAADYICHHFLDQKLSILEAGESEKNTAIIHVLCLLYEKTRKPEYLAMVRHIEKSWDEPEGGGYIEAGLKGIPFFETRLPRWESLHGIQGIFELYKITGEEKYSQAYQNLWWGMLTYDRHNTGGFSSGERARGNPYSQKPIETCCTVAWMALSIDMLRLTGNSYVADELELSSFNGMLGSQHPSGRWWTYNTPMDGVRKASAHDIVFQALQGSPELNCCSVNGPRGLGMFSQWALTSSEEGVALNYYGPSEFSFTLDTGCKVTIRQKTDYPISGHVQLQMELAEPWEFQLKLRVPVWSTDTGIHLNGKPQRGAAAGQYFGIKRRWANNDTIDLHLDMSLHYWVGEREYDGKVSIYRGPLLLAFDQRFNRIDTDGIPAFEKDAIQYEVESWEPWPKPWILLKCTGREGRQVYLCDFASAGMTGGRYISWLPGIGFEPADFEAAKPSWNVRQRGTTVYKGDSSMAKISKEYELVVIGGGMSGLCAAIAAARYGVKTALIQNRPVLGGNASSEIRMHISGANYMGRRADARETGIVEEIKEENAARNPYQSWSIFDTVLWETVHFQERLDLYLNTHCDEVTVQNSRIVSIAAKQLTTEKVYDFQGKLFMDATGDGTVGYLAGAEYMSGREGKDVFGEQLAPDKSDDYTMGSSLLFKAVDVGKPVAFRKPSWANTYTEEDLKLRNHSEVTSGYWWVELGGMEQSTIGDAEEIRDELLKALYGIWDHIKNGGAHGAETLDLDWVGFLPGKRESRRFLGDTVLTEKDALEGRVFEDAVAYGGWSLDLHAMGGLRNTREEAATVTMEQYIPKDVFTIPYRSLYSKNIENLFIGGRAISVSHVAFGGTRQMGTCSVVGQAVGTACALAVEREISPREVGRYMKELQQRLLRDDCYIPGCRNEDEKDLARSAEVSCSSHLDGCDGKNVINGVARRVKENRNAWISEKMDGEEWVSLSFGNTIRVKELRLSFDPNLTPSLSISLSKGALSKWISGTPRELVKDYDLELYHDSTLVHEEQIKDNYFRHRVHELPEAIRCNRIKITVKSTRGDQHARIFEIRAYDEH
jgi:DUF1680 family protein